MFPSILPCIWSNKHKGNRSDLSLSWTPLLNILVCVLSRQHCTQTSSWCQLLSVSLSLLCLLSSFWKQHLPPVVWKPWAARRAVCRLTGKPSPLCNRSRIWHAACAWKSKTGKLLLKAIEWGQELINFLWIFQADLKSEIFVLGKPPRSPVMSRRSCGSPVRGLSSSHRVGSEHPPTPGLGTLATRPQ